MQPMLAMEPGSYVALLGVVILVGVMLRMTYRKQRNSRPTPRTFAREHIAKLKEEHAMKGDMEELMVQLQELSRNISAQIDTKFAKLEASIRSADERIEKLQRLQRATEGQPTIDTVITDDIAPEPTSTRPPKPEPADPQHDQIYTLADAGDSVVQIAQEIGKSPGEIELILSLRNSARSRSS